MTPENLLTTGAGMLCLALGGGLLQGERERRLAAAGLLVLGLAIGAWHAGSPPGGGLTPPGRLGQGFLVGNGGLLLLGAALGCLAALRGEPGPFRPAARSLTAAGVVLLGWVLAAFLGTAGPARALAAALAIGLAGLTVAAAGRALVGGPVGILGRRLAPPPLVPDSIAGAGPWLPVVLVAAGAAALGPHAAMVLGGLIAATWAGYLAFHRAGHRPLPVAPVLTLLLVPAYWLLATVAGPVGLAIPALSQAPLSPAAELLVSPALLLAAWATAGLWPLQRQLPGALLAPVGALLLARVVLPLAPGGLEYWRPLSVPLVLLGLWNAAACGRWPLVLSGAGFLGLVGGPPDLAAIAWLLAGGLALELGSSAAVPPRARAVVHVALWPLATWAGLRVVEQALRGEVVYTALGLLGLAVIVAARREPALISAPGRIHICRLRRGKSFGVLQLPIQEPVMAFSLPPLPYDYNALEPHIDEQTMRIHHDKHHGTYVNNLNAALEQHPQLQGKSVEELLASLDTLPEAVRTPVRNNGGGHANHTAFWEMMAPGGAKEPGGALAAAIDKAFGGFDKFKEQFAKACAGRFGSGWAWLIADPSGGLSIDSTPNQDTPVMQKKQPILGCDVWEHAYYLKYQNRRPDYVTAWWNVVNWTDIGRRYDKAVKK